MAYVQQINPLHAPHGAQRQGLIVLGVGRSGTSVLTHCMSLLGAALPNMMIGAGDGNEAGHWEPAYLVFLNDEILTRHGQTWLHPKPIPREWFASPEAQRLAGQIASIIAGEYGRARLFVLKDPRICRLLPLYLRAFEMLDIAPFAVLPLRHPAAVSGSVARRDGIQPEAGEHIWAQDLLTSEAASRNMPRVWLEYDALLADPAATLTAIGQGLGIAWPVPPAHAADAIAACINPALRHFQPAACVAPRRLVERLWAMARLGPAGEEVLLRLGFDSIRQAIQAPSCQNDAQLRRITSPTESWANRAL